MKPAKAINALKNTFEPLSETFAEQFSKMGDEALKEIMGVMPSRNSGTLAAEDLKRAREQKSLEEKKKEDSQRSQRQIEFVKQQYSSSETSADKHQQMLVEQVQELQVQIVELAKTAGVETKIHLQNTSKKEKVSLLTIKLLTSIIKTLRLKAKEAKSGSELVSQRSNAKRPTGMLAWVSGKQMKIHEQGTLQLQG